MRSVKQSWAIAILVWLIALPALAASGPKAELLPRWTKHTQASTRSFDDKPWNEFLGRNVRTLTDGRTVVDYQNVSQADKARLKAYIAALSATDVDSLSRPEQFAFWVNLYNAATVDLVLQRYPIKSIRQIKPNPFAFGPWGMKILVVRGEKLSLDDIEHGILRPIWHDPRIHFAVNCASVGCPNLINRAFSASDLDSQLDAAAKAYITHPRGFAIENGRLVASSIFEWYAADFGGEKGVLAFARRYNPVLVGRTKIDATRYDWNLNDAR